MGFRKPSRATVCLLNTHSCTYTQSLPTWLCSAFILLGALTTPYDPCVLRDLLKTDRHFFYGQRGTGREGPLRRGECVERLACSLYRRGMSRALFPASFPPILSCFINHLGMSGFREMAEIQLDTDYLKHL